jgi:ABC-2 type transport system ATP-binding protein
VLKGITCAIGAGECLGVTGPNDAGKSTLLGAFAGWLPATRGSVIVSGRPVRGGVVPLSVGLATQDVTLYPRLTGRENLALFGYMYGLRERALADRADEMLRRFDLERWADRRAGTYSAGVARRLHLALAFIHQPALLLLDEPTNALDPGARQTLLQEVRELLAQGTAVVVTSQNLSDLELLAHRLLVMVDGEQRLLDDTQELVSRLGSGVVEIEVAEAGGRLLLEPDLNGIEGVLSSRFQDGVLRAQVANPSRSLPAILSRLEKQGLLAARVEMRPPSLEQLLHELVPAS